MLDRAQTHILSSIETKHLVYDHCIGSILIAAELLVTAFTTNHKLLLCGNGGSAADCQHMATELTGKLSLTRKGLPAIALTTDTSFLTAYSNDYSFNSVFERQVITHGYAGDVLVAISTSGLSQNVIYALHAAIKLGMKTIAITSERGIKLHIADVPIRVPSTNTQYIQEAHLMIEHIICDLVEQRLFGDLKTDTHKYVTDGCSTADQCLVCHRSIIDHDN